MVKNIKEHEDEYFHINKIVFGIITMWIIGLFLLFSNVVLMVRAYPEEISIFVGTTSIFFWIMTVILLVTTSYAIDNTYGKELEER